MTVAALPSTVTYQEDGVTLTFAVPYRFRSAADLVVERILGGGLRRLSLGADYSVVGGETDAGGSITRTIATNGGMLRIRRVTARAQPMTYTAGDRFPANSHEEALDRAILISQEQDADLGDTRARALLVPPGEQAMVLPIDALRRDSVLAWDQSGVPVARRVGSFPPGPRGPQGYSAATIEQLRIAPVSDGPLMYDGSVWDFVEGDFSATPPEQLDVNIVQSTGLPLSFGAWRRQSTDSVTNRPGWTVAPARPQASVNNDRASIFDVISSPLQQERIRLGTSDYDASPDFIRATTDAAIERRELYVPAGTFQCWPGTPKFDEDNNGNPAPVARGSIRMVSGMRLIGERGATLRLPNNSSTDANPRSLALLHTNQQLRDIAITGITFDLNAANNRISPRRAEGIYNRFNMAAIEVSGTPGGVAAKIDDMHIERNVFKNCPGVCMIVCAQSNSQGVQIGRGWRILFNDFLEHGLDSDDGTAVFAWCDDVLLLGNRFINRQPFGAVGRTGGNTCYEIHGEDHRVIANEFVNYIRGIWVSSNLTSEVRRSIITKNTFRTLFYGVDFFRTVSALSEIVDTTIEGNKFFFDDTLVPSVPGLNFKAAVQVASEYRQREIDVTGNSAYKTGTSVGSAFMVVSGGRPDNLHTAIRVNGNKGRGLTFGNFVRTTPSSGIGQLDLTGNQWHNLTPAGGFASAYGDVIEQTATPQTIDQLILGGGSCIDDRDAPQLAAGVRINTNVGRLDRMDAVVRNASQGAWIEEAGIAVGVRSGFYNAQRAYDPPSIANGNAANVAISAPGARLGDSVAVAFNVDLAGVGLSAWVAAPGSITARFENRTGAAVDLAAGVLSVRYGRGD